MTLLQAILLAMLYWLAAGESLYRSPTASVI